MSYSSMVSTLCCTGILVVSTAISAQAQPLKTFPEKSGFGGNVSFGPTYLAVTSNFATDQRKLGEDELESLDQQADTGHAVLAYPRVELLYTFARAGWQLHFGNTSLDFYRFDRANVAGVKKNLGKVGVIGVGYVFSVLPDYVWEDAYKLSAPRESTRRGSAGGRVTWEFIGGTPVNLRYTQRNIRVSDESSGSDLGLSAEQQAMLRRDGTQRLAEVNMFVPAGNGRILLPALSYIRNDREGEAVSNDYIQLRLTYKMDLSPRWIMLADALGGRLNARETNPVFDDREQNWRYGAALTFKRSELFNVDGLALILRAGSYRERSNIDFYSGRIDNIGAYLGYEF